MLVSLHTCSRHFRRGLFPTAAVVRGGSFFLSSRSFRSMADSTPLLVVDKFCLRQFDPDSQSLSQVGMAKEEFENRINEMLSEAGGLSCLKDGYAPFCKHFFVENFTQMKSACIKITSENKNLLCTEYKSRNEKELKVLQRWFPASSFGDLPRAKYLDCILYSREQIKEENAKMGEDQQATNAPWGIVSIKAQDVDHELPMNPITQMRNALGKEHGGSGVPLNIDSYNASVAFWSSHASIL
mmetsp:Transcript_6630/g.8029  ORF Transcript_6630/g.8029 Transcript_6630/m.8029 type:complete len:241 (+) Transcript_6630:39-761(+)